ncbi:MAG: type II secretion system protein [Verrucomicrobia bacterium]|nr:type II secretion system protein [Verrucomicrobiota bacterium]
MNHQKHNLIGCFTLVELLVVVAIVSILAALLLPAIKNAHESAYSAKRLHNLKQLMTAAFMYCDDNNGRFSDGGDSVIVALNYPRTKWADDLFAYSGNKIEVLECPSQKVLRAAGANYQAIAPPNGPESRKWDIDEDLNINTP